MSTRLRNKPSTASYCQFNYAIKCKMVIQANKVSKSCTSQLISGPYYRTQMSFFSLLFFKQTTLITVKSFARTLQCNIAGIQHIVFVEVVSFTP